MQGTAERWQVRAEAAEVPGLRRRVGELAGGDGLSDQQVAGVELATCEAATNAVRHGYPSGPRGTITVEVLTKHGSVRVQISDDGVGLGSPSIDPGAGLGTRLIDSLASQVDRSRSHGGGACIDMLFTA